MPFNITVHHRPACLLLEVSGPALLADLMGLMDLAATIARRSGQRRVLLNLVDVQISLTFTDHLHLGTYTAQQLAGMERVASVVSLENRKGTSEKAAQNMGLQFKTFTDLAAAMSWVAASTVSQ